MPRVWTKPAHTVSCGDNVLSSWSCSAALLGTAAAGCEQRGGCLTFHHLHNWESPYEEGRTWIARLRTGTLQVPKGLALQRVECPARTRPVLAWV